jgi:hypothetical protein
MEVKDLKAQVRFLATVSENRSGVVSCYLDLSDGIGAARRYLRSQWRWMRRGLSPERCEELEEALLVVSHRLYHLEPSTRGVAFFLRLGDEPFVRFLEFGIPVPNWIGIGSTPDIYHLIELKETYHRYVVVLCHPERVRILEVNLGAVTAQVWKDRPEIRDRVGREWTRRRYQRRLGPHDRAFVQEVVEMLEARTEAGGYQHFVLAGDPGLIRAVREALPSGLAARLVDSVPTSSRDRLRDVVDATLGILVEQVERESLGAVDELERELATSGLAAAGEEEVREALEDDRVDVLLVERRWDSSSRDALIGRAAARDCEIEIVEESDALLRLGGVACLLRHREERAVGRPVATPEPLLAGAGGV